MLYNDFKKPIYRSKILENLVDIKDDGSFRLNQSFFNYATGLTMTNKKFEKLFGQKARVPNKEELTQFHMDVASSIQLVTEEIMLKITKAIRDEFDIENLCFRWSSIKLCCKWKNFITKDIQINLIQPAARR